MISRGHFARSYLYQLVIKWGISMWDPLYHDFGYIPYIIYAKLVPRKGIAYLSSWSFSAEWPIEKIIITTTDSSGQEFRHSDTTFSSQYYQSALFRFANTELILYLGWFSVFRLVFDRPMCLRTLVRLTKT